MEAYMQRVVEEKKDLDGKITRLIEFLECRPSPVEGFERGLMLQQLCTMETYSKILGERIRLYLNKHPTVRCSEGFQVPQGEVTDRYVPGSGG